MHACFSRLAFDKAIAPIRPALLHQAAKRCGAQNADDLVQDCLLRAWQIVDRFDSDSGQSAFTAWLMRILDHVCNEWIRSQSARPETLLPLDAILALSEQPELCQVDAWYRERLRGVMYLKLKRIVITPKQRDCILSWLDEEDQRTIGERWGISQQAVAGHIRRVVALLKKREKEEIDMEVLEIYRECLKAIVYRRPQRTGAALARERLQKMK